MFGSLGCSDTLSYNHKKEHFFSFNLSLAQQIFGMRPSAIGISATKKRSHVPPCIICEQNIVDSQACDWYKFVMSYDDA